MIQVLIAGALMQWEYRTPTPRGSEYFVPPARLLRLGLDAPARPVPLLDPNTLACIFSSSPLEGPVFRWLPEPILGFYSANILFLIGTSATWYFVGRAMDHRVDGVEGGVSNVKLAFAYVFMFGLGGLLFALGVHDLGLNGGETTIPEWT